MIGLCIWGARANPCAAILVEGTAPGRRLFVACVRQEPPPREFPAKYATTCHDSLALAFEHIEHALAMVPRETPKEIAP